MRASRTTSGAPRSRTDCGRRSCIFPVGVTTRTRAPWPVPNVLGASGGGGNTNIATATATTITIRTEGLAPPLSPRPLEDCDRANTVALSRPPERGWIFPWFHDAISEATAVRHQPAHMGGTMGASGCSSSAATPSQLGRFTRPFRLTVRIDRSARRLVAGVARHHHAQGLPFGL